MNRKLVFAVMMSLCNIWGCTKPDAVQPSDAAAQIAAMAPYGNTDPESWREFFHRHRAKITPDAVALIIERSVGATADLEQISSTLSSMSISNSIRRDRSKFARFGIQEPRIEFYLTLNHRTSVWTIRDVYGVVSTNSDKGHEKRILAKDTFTGP